MDITINKYVLLFIIIMISACSLGVGMLVGTRKKEYVFTKELYTKHTDGIYYLDAKAALEGDK